MRKILMIVMAMGMSAASYAGTVIPKIGIDGQGGMNDTPTSALQPEKTFNASPGISIGAEYLNKYNDAISYGAGIETQFQRVVIRDRFCPTFNFTPLYFTCQYAVWDSLKYKPYVKANFGWDLFFTGNSDFNLGFPLKGGPYYAVGIGGRVYKDLVVAELMYSFYSGTLKGAPNIGGGTYDIDCVYRVLGLKVGYCFELGK